MYRFDDIDVLGDPVSIAFPVGDIVITDVKGVPGMTFVHQLRQKVASGSQSQFIRDGQEGGEGWKCSSEIEGEFLRGADIIVHYYQSQVIMIYQKYQTSLL